MGLSNQTTLQAVMTAFFRSDAGKAVHAFLANPAFTADATQNLTAISTLPGGYTATGLSINYSGRASATYDSMVTSLNTFITDASANVARGSVRGLVTLPDGTVVYDSSRGANNTATRAHNKLINENHMSRQVLMKAVFGPQGALAYDSKYSTSTQKNEEYVGVCLGGDGIFNLGIVRFSVDAV